MSGKGPQNSEEQRLLKWLETQGYSLQMQVAKLFEQAGFDVSQFEKYRDPNEPKFREIDVVASTSREFDGLTVSVAFLIECKYAKDYPWVIFTSPRRFTRSPLFSRILPDAFNTRNWQENDSIQARLVARILNSQTSKGTGERIFFSVPRSVGYNVVESRSGGKDNAYGAIMQVSSCTQSYDMQDERAFQSSIADFEKHTYETGTGEAKLSVYARIVFPVVVGRGHLFECYLERDRSVAVSQVQHGIVLVPSKDPEDTALFPSGMSAVSIVAEEYVERFVVEAYQAAHSLLSEEKAIREVWDFERDKLLPRPATDELPF